MAVNQLQLPSYQVNNLVDQGQWNSLGNLGKVYQEAQDAANKKAALSSLGTDPQANMATLLRSGDPALAQLGISLQQKEIERQREAERNAVADKHWQLQYGIQAAAARRAQEASDLAEKERLGAGAAAAPFVFDRTGTPGAPAPFPAPLPAGVAPPTAAPPAAPPQATMPVMPGQNGVIGNATPAPPPQATMPPPPPPEAPPAPQPSAFSATPPMPSALQPPPVAPPVKAEGDETGLPAWASPQSLTGRMANSLSSGQPVGGITREQFVEAYKNPNTRALATAWAQNQTNPGTWKVEKTEDGRLFAFNDKTLQSKDITPGGEAGKSKQEREVEGYYKAAIAQGQPEQTARLIALNKGKLPSEDLHPDERKQIYALTDMAESGQRVLANLEEFKALSPKAWGYPGAQHRAEQMGYLPEALQPQGALDTQKLTNITRSNVANVAKSVFGNRITNADLALLTELEGSANQPDEVRQDIARRTGDMITRKINQAKSEAEGIRNKTFFKPGGGNAVTGETSAPSAAPSGTKPSLKDFMDKARAANPGVSDGDLARYWKGEYGG